MYTWLDESIEVQFRTIDGLSVRFAESEDRSDHALLLNPWPESLLAFQQMWGRLAEHTHLIAIDLPGFGHSQQRDTLLSPRTMSEFIVRLADAFGLENPHAVGPDIGTAAFLFAAAFQPERFRSVVVGSGGAAVPLDLGSRLKDSSCLGAIAAGFVPANYAATLRWLTGTNHLQQRFPDE